MPKWWPWGRSKHPDPEPIAPAIRPEPAWHRLPAVQRTVGDIETTTHLQGFTESLTTSQNPGFTAPLELLSAKHSDRLPVLDGVRDSAGVAAHPAAASAAPTPQSRTWAPSPMAVQRALFQSTAMVQRTADAAAPVRDIHPVNAVGPTEAPPHSMVQAPPPDDRRMLDVASDPEIVADEPQSVDAVAPQPTSDQENGAVDGISSNATEEPVSPSAHGAPSATDAPLPAVQRVQSAMDPSPAAPQAVSATSLASITTSVRPPLRHLPSVQRSVTGSSSAPAEFSSARPIPVLRTVESPVSGQPPQANLDATITAARGDGATLQRSSDPEPARTIPTDAATPSIPAPVPPSTHSVSASEHAVMRSVDAHQSGIAPPPLTAQRLTASSDERKSAPRAQHAASSDAVETSSPAVDAHQSGAAPPPMTAQRLTASTDERKSAPRAQHGPTLHAVVTSSPVAGLQRLPVVGVRPATPVGSAGPERKAAAQPFVQRSPEWSTETVTNVQGKAADAPGVAGGSGHLPFAEESEASREFAPEARSEATRELNAVSDAAVPHHAAASTPPAGVVQRVALPVVQPTAAPTQTGSPATPAHSDSSAAPVVQRAATSGRLVVLPPVRSSGAQDAPDSSSSGSARSVLFDSPRPVGLQRMFEHHTGKSADSATDFKSADSASAGFASTAFSSADSYSRDSDPGVPNFETTGSSYDATANTITFSSPTVQREPEAAPASPEPAPAAAPAATMMSAPAAPGPAAAGDVDELVNRLYDPLAARLRAELWLDRERAGVLMDLGR